MNVLFLKAEEFRSGQNIIKKRVAWDSRTGLPVFRESHVRSWSRCNEKLRDAIWAPSNTMPFMQNINPLYEY
jgi:hypothetical protein